jgi:hypothetical protein
VRKLAVAAFAIAAIALGVMQRHVFADDKKDKDAQLQGYYTHIPWDGGSPADGALHALSGSSVPMFNYSITATKDNSNRAGTMVGTSPFVSPRTGTTISTVVVPLKVTIGTTVFDPLAANNCDGGVATTTRFTSSPLVQSVTNLTINGVNVGTTQFVNGFRRAEFWNTINSGSPNTEAAYQNTLSPVIVAAEASVSAGSHGTLYSSGCTQLGIVAYNWLDNYLRNTLMPQLTNNGTISPSKFVIFLLRNVVQSESDPPSVNNCCILGYHGATGNPVQTYSPMDWDTTGDFGSSVADASVASHETAEWMDDPLGTNPTPLWGNIGQVGGCQNNLEVGDPLSGKLMPGYTLGGKTYHMQELGFFSWYFNKLGIASLGTGGKFSSNATFGGPSKACPPGGTN